jgi:hypothetical protein
MLWTIDAMPQHATGPRPVVLVAPGSTAGAGCKYAGFRGDRPSS